MDVCRCCCLYATGSGARESSTSSSYLAAHAVIRRWEAPCAGLSVCCRTNVSACLVIERAGGRK